MEEVFRNKSVARLSDFHAGGREHSKQDVGLPIFLLIYALFSSEQTQKCVSYELNMLVNLRRACVSICASWKGRCRYCGIGCGWILAFRSCRKGCLSDFALQSSLQGTRFWLVPSQCLSFRSTRGQTTDWSFSGLCWRYSQHNGRWCAKNCLCCNIRTNVLNTSIWRCVMTVSRD